MLVQWLLGAAGWVPRKARLPLPIRKVSAACPISAWRTTFPDFCNAVGPSDRRPCSPRDSQAGQDARPAGKGRGMKNWHLKAHREKLGRKILTKTIFHWKLPIQQKGWWFSLTLQGLQQSTVCFPASSPSPLLSLLNLAIIKILEAEKASGFPDGDCELKSLCGCRSSARIRRAAKVQGQKGLPQ